MPPKPTQNDLEALRSRYRLAVDALDRIRWEGGGPIYPKEVNEFMSLLDGPPWSRPSYDEAAATRALADLEGAGLDELGQLFLRLQRSERFSAGAWASLLKGGIPLPSVFDRIESLLAPPPDLRSPKPPLEHPLAIAAMRQARIWFFMALVPLALGWLVEWLRTHDHIGRGNGPAPLYIVAAAFALAWVFCLLVGWRGQREIARIRRGDYLARWSYWGGGVGAEAIEERRRKVQLLLFVPLIVFALGGLALGGIGAYMKGNGGLVWQVGAGGAAIGLGIGLLFAVPAWFLMGIRISIAEKLPSETIFTETGFYQPGRFVPVKSWAKGQREIALKFPDRHDGRTRLDFQLRQHSSRHPESFTHITAHFAIPVPEGGEGEAAALAEHFLS